MADKIAYRWLAVCVRSDSPHTRHDRSEKCKRARVCIHRWSELPTVSIIATFHQIIHIEILPIQLILYVICTLPCCIASQYGAHCFFFISVACGVLVVAFWIHVAAAFLIYVVVLDPVENKLQGTRTIIWHKTIFFIAPIHLCRKGTYCRGPAHRRGRKRHGTRVLVIVVVVVALPIARNERASRSRNKNEKRKKKCPTTETIFKKKIKYRPRQTESEIEWVRKMSCKK